jgi:hypothetical protein
MLISWHWTNSIGRSEQQPIETTQCERVGGPDSNCPVLSACIQNSAVLTPVGVLDSNQSSYGWRPGLQVSDNENKRKCTRKFGLSITNYFSIDFSERVVFKGKGQTRKSTCTVLPLYCICLFMYPFPWFELLKKYIFFRNSIAALHTVEGFKEYNLMRSFTAQI